MTPVRSGVGAPREADLGELHGNPEAQLQRGKVDPERLSLRKSSAGGFDEPLEERPARGGAA